MKPRHGPGPQSRRFIERARKLLQTAAARYGHDREALSAIGRAMAEIGTAQHLQQQADANAAAEKAAARAEVVA